MNRVARWLVGVSLATVLLGAWSEVRADPPAVVTVISAKVKGDGSAYLKKLKAGKPLIMKLGAKSVRYFRASIAGEGTGRIFSVAEYDNAEAFGKARAKRSEDEEFKKWFADLVNSGLSEDVRSELMEEIQP